MRRRSHKSLEDRRVLVTGAGHGLGRALAGAFAEAGARLIVTDRDRDGVEATTGWLCGRGDPAIGLTMDVTSAESIEETRRQVLEQAGHIDILVNNAGTVHGGRFGDVPLQKHLATLQVNTLGPIQVTHAFLPDLLCAPASYVVNIVSAAALVAMPGGASYAASKWALLGFTESLRAELRHDGHDHVGVLAVCPSFIATGLFAGAKPPRFTRVLTPQSVAAAVVTAVRKQRQMLVLPRLVGLVPPLRALLPEKIARRIADWLGITTSMNDWQGHLPLSTSEPAPPATPALAGPAELLSEPGELVGAVETLESA